MTLGVCQGRSSIASFSIVTSASRGPSAIAEPLVILGLIPDYVNSMNPLIPGLENEGLAVASIA